MDKNLEQALAFCVRPPVPTGKADKDKDKNID